MSEASWIEYVVICLYFVFMILTGFAFRHFNKNFSDYFRGGCRCSWWLVGASAFMTTFTAWTFTGGAGAAYTAGVAVSVIFIGNGLGYLTNYFITAKYYRQMRAVTFPEIIAERFDLTTQQFYVWFGSLTGTLMVSLTLWSVALFTASVFGFNVVLLILVLGGVIVLYSTVGGSWSVMATDFLQALILLPMTILISVLALYAIGGFSGFYEALQDQNLTHMLSPTNTRDGNPYSVLWALGMLSYTMVTFNSAGFSIKYFSCKDGKEAKKAALLAAVLMFIGAALWFIPPMVARLLYAADVEALGLSAGIKNPAEASYAVIAVKLLPKGMVGMMVVAMFAATMSSLSTMLNQSAAMFTQDFYQKILRPKATGREMFITGQIVSFITGVVIVAVAIALSTTGGNFGLFEYMLIFGSLFGMPMIVPMFLALFIRKTPSWSAMLSIFTSLMVSALSFSQNWNSQPGGYQLGVFAILLVGTLSFVATIPFWKEKTTKGLLIFSAVYFVIGLCLAGLAWHGGLKIIDGGSLTVVYVVKSLIVALSMAGLAWVLGRGFILTNKDPQTKREEINGFYERMHRPVDFEKEIGSASDPRQLKLVGFVSLSIGVFMALMILIPNPIAGRLQIMALSGFTAGFGAIMIYAGNRMTKKSKSEDSQ